ncbi:hypothetical protein GW590_15450 [Rahnella sp. SAP-1]|uniref:SidE PDE domain-containing protein n=1 Tax=Rouxiella aceris TaxID=2703884 RepID=A0A848MIZ6_9GAMM|nr:SidE phosphodiesterase domain-containing protein [Rouxiella aceris]NMP28257.1 hypothetical protein [Rouxiella aceris]
MPIAEGVKATPIHIPYSSPSSSSINRDDDQHMAMEKLLGKKTSQNELSEQGLLKPMPAELKELQNLNRADLESVLQTFMDEHQPPLTAITFVCFDDQGKMSAATTVNAGTENIPGLRFQHSWLTPGEEIGHENGSFDQASDIDYFRSVLQSAEHKIAEATATQPSAALKTWPTFNSIEAINHRVAAKRRAPPANAQNLSSPAQIEKLKLEYIAEIKSVEKNKTYRFSTQNYNYKFPEVIFNKNKRFEIKKDLLPVFSLANEIFYKRDYPHMAKDHKQNKIEVDKNHIIHRPNHNGSHGIRQSFICQALIENLSAEQQMLLSDVDRKAIAVMAFMMRSGRLHETYPEQKQHSQDEKKQIKKEVYGHYSQLSARAFRNIATNIAEFTAEDIDRYTQILANTYTRASKDATDSDRLIKHILETSHDLELTRCYSKTEFDALQPSMGKKLGLDAQCVEKLKKYTLALQAKSGFQPRYTDPRNRHVDYNTEKYHLFSNNMQHCVEVYNTIPKP